MLLSGSISESQREILLNQYESISKDFTYMFQEWEDGKKALNDLMEPIPSADPPDLSSSRISTDEDAETLKDENDLEENISEKTINIDWTKMDEPSNVPEQIFEAEAEVVEPITTKVNKRILFVNY